MNQGLSALIRKRKNNLNKVQQTRPKSNENTEKSMNPTDILPLITVWLQARVLPGLPRKTANLSGVVPP
jgi:hypothetical protein